MPDNRGDSLERLSLAAAMAQSYARDQYGFSGLVASLLEASLPQHIEVERKPVKLFSQDKRVARIKIVLGDETFELIDPGGGRAVSTRKQKIVRGICLKTEELRIDQWLEQLDAAVFEHAQGNQYASDAINAFLQQHGLS